MCQFQDVLNSIILTHVLNSYSTCQKNEERRELEKKVRKNKKPDFSYSSVVSCVNDLKPLMFMQKLLQLLRFGHTFDYRIGKAN